VDEVKPRTVSSAITRHLCSWDIAL